MCEKIASHFNPAQLGGQELLHLLILRRSLSARIQSEALYQLRKDQNLPPLCLGYEHVENFDATDEILETKRPRTVKMKEVSKGPERLGGTKLYPVVVNLAVTCT